MENLRKKAPHHASSEFKNLKEAGRIDSEGYIIDEKDITQIDVVNPLQVSQNDELKNNLKLEKEDNQTMFTKQDVTKMFDDFKSEMNEKLAFPQNNQNRNNAPQTIIQQITNQKLSIDDDIPEFKNWEFKDREYRLCGNKKPVSRQIATSHSVRRPLQYLHKEKKQVFGLRYSTTQPSLFVENQSTGLGDVRQEEIHLEFGTLRVPAQMVTLQKFLAITPDNKINGGAIFYEFDADAESQKNINAKKHKKEAYSLIDNAGKLTNRAIVSLETVGYIDAWTDKQVEEATYNFVEKDPKKYIELVNDSSITIKGIVKTAIAKGKLVWKNYRFYDDNSRLILEVAQNANEIDEMAKYLQTGEGRTLLDFFKNLE